MCTGDGHGIHARHNRRAADFRKEIPCNPIISGNVRARKDPQTPTRKLTVSNAGRSIFRQGKRQSTARQKNMLDLEKRRS
jgi:hypothetical protein